MDRKDAISRYTPPGLHERKKEWADYVRGFEEGEDILTAASLWLPLLLRGRRAGVRIRSYEYAKRLLHCVVGGQRGSTIRLSRQWHERLSEFGLQWDGSEVTIRDHHRWRHALAILRKTGRLPYRFYLQRIGSGCHYDDPINRADLPPLHWTPRKIVWPAGQPYQDQEAQEMNGSSRSYDYFPSQQSYQTAYNPIARFVNRLIDDP